MIRTVNLISGEGSTNLAVLEAQKPGGRLSGLVETVAIISSDPQATGIKKALDSGFPSAHIHVVSTGPGLARELLAVLDQYQPDYFHQLGWVPKTPTEVINRYDGLNQHLGPGGRWMYRARRIYALLRFEALIGEKRLLPIFCQRVASEYDAGNVIYARWIRMAIDESAEQIADRVLPIEHAVQIEALRRLATGHPIRERPVPRFARAKGQEELLLQAKREARDRYPPES